MATKTGKKSISVAGRMVYVRHATEWDIDTIRRESKDRWPELDGLGPERVVVAAEEDAIVGFGLVARPSADGTVCVTLFQKRDRRQLGPSIVRHVLENQPLIKTLRESAGLPDHAVKMVVSRKKRGSSKDASSACPLPARSARTAGKKQRH